VLAVDPSNWHLRNDLAAPRNTKTPADLKPGAPPSRMSRSSPKPRTALRDGATRLMDYPVTTAVAPAGSGKSTLLAYWLERLKATQASTSMLDLTPLHSDPRILLTDLIEACRQSLPTSAASANKRWPASLTPSGIGASTSCATVSEVIRTSSSSTIITTSTPTRPANSSFLPGRPYRC
jgi:hypothetical protein